MKPSLPLSRDQRLDLVALLLLLLVYVVVMGFQYSFVQQTDTAANSIPSAIAQERVRAVRPVVATPVPAPKTALRGRRTLVFIVNFLDSKRCGETLQSMFANSVSPELLKVSVHDQIRDDLGELPCVDAYCQLVGEKKCRRAQIVSTQVHAKDARGPTVARYITEKAIGDEDFCLGLDSHLVFVDKWDEKLVTHWDSIENENAILTVYPKSLDYLTKDHSMDHKMGLMCRAHIETAGDDAMVQYLTVKWLDRDNTTKPLLHSQFAGGFNFGSCKSYKEVPNDPYTPILFYGEEYARAARLWTHGYDFYAPAVDIVYHWYETRTKIWDEDWSQRYQMLMKSRRRTRFMMGLPVSQDDFDHTDLDKYGLGKKRTFEQWKQFSGIDPLAPYDDKVIEQFDNCRDLALVPFLST